jgi:DNA polymerase-3 subunit gamma/tau
MSESTNQSLATKHRPKKLSKLIGNSDAVLTVRGILKAAKSKKVFPKAFLLSGATGCGKTTLSRILASYLTCESYSSCGQCAACKAGSSNMDVLEKNLSDNRGIDDIRDLIAIANMKPQISKYRILILEECHQITTAAANALLSPIENSPPHVIWIFNTTNPERLPVPLQRRLMVIKLKKPSISEIEGALKRIAYVEKQKIPTSAISKIALESNGHVRDAINLLESWIIQRNGGSSSPVVLNNASEDVINAVRIMRCVYANDTRELLSYNIKDPISLLIQCMFINSYALESSFKASTWAYPETKELINKYKPKAEICYRINDVLHETYKRCTLMPMFQKELQIALSKLLQ